MSGLDGVEWEVCLLEPLRNRERERALRAALGIVPRSTRYFLDSSWLSDAMARFGGAPMQHLTPEMVEMITLVVSQDNSCCYCYTATRGFMKILGFPESHIRRLEENFLSADLTPADAAALEFARCVSRAAPLPTVAHTQPLFAAGYGTAAVKELAVFAAHSVFFNRVSTLPALPPEEADFAERWWVRLLRPLIAARVRALRVPAPVPLSPRSATACSATSSMRSTVCRPHRAYARCSTGRGARRRSARASKPSSSASWRAALAARPPSAKSVRLLVAEGMGPSAVEHALAHLSGGDLDPMEQAALELARESIWYEPVHLQRRARGCARSSRASNSST